MTLCTYRSQTFWLCLTGLVSHGDICLMLARRTCLSVEEGHGNTRPAFTPNCPVKTEKYDRWGHKLQLQPHSTGTNDIALFHLQQRPVHSVKNLSPQERNSNKDTLSIEELGASECLIVKGLQQQTFPRERKSLSQNHSVHETSKLHNLNAFIQDGIICFGTGLKNTSTLVGKQHPVIGHITELTTKWPNIKAGNHYKTVRSHGIGTGSSEDPRLCLLTYTTVLTCRKVRTPKKRRWLTCQVNVSTHQHRLLALEWISSAHS